MKNETYRGFDSTFCGTIFEKKTVLLPNDYKHSIIFQKKEFFRRPEKLFVLQIKPSHFLPWQDALPAKTRAKTAKEAKFVKSRIGAGLPGSDASGLKRMGGRGRTWLIFSGKLIYRKRRASRGCLILSGIETSFRFYVYKPLSILCPKQKNDSYGNEQKPDYGLIKEGLRITVIGNVQRIMIKVFIRILSWMIRAKEFLEKPNGVIYQCTSSIPFE